MKSAFRSAGVVAGLTALLLAQAASALGQGKLISDPEQVQRVLSLLDDSYWIADGANADKQVYVIFSTTCGYCKQLHANTRAAQNRPQLRWITADEAGRGAEDVLTRRNAAAIGDVFNGRSRPPADAAVAARALEINKALSFALPEIKSVVYPTLLYLTAQGLQVHVGMPSNLKLFDTVKARPEQAKYEPASLKWVQEPPTITSAPKFNKYWSKDGGTPVVVAPVENSPAILLLPKGRGYDVDGIANGEWARVKIAYRAGNRPVYAYVHAPREIRLATMQFQVKRAAGQYLTGQRTVEARSHPTLEADVLETIEPGMQLTKTGEVLLDGEKWTEVVLYTDGTKGYIKE